VSAPAPALRPLRHAWLWLVCAWLGLIVTVVGSLMPMPDTGLSIEGGDKLGHGLGYFALAAWYVQLYAGARAQAWRMLGLVALGAAIELIQAQTSWRSAEWRDFLANLAGTLAGWATAATPLARLLERWDRPAAPR
jgi:VanZ family protein